MDIPFKHSLLGNTFVEHLSNRETTSMRSLTLYRCLPDLLRVLDAEFVDSNINGSTITATYKIENYFRTKLMDKLTLNISQETTLSGYRLFLNFTSHLGFCFGYGGLPGTSSGIDYNFKKPKQNEELRREAGGYIKVMDELVSKFYNIYKDIPIDQKIRFIKKNPF